VTQFWPARQDLAAGFAGSALPGPRLTSSSTRAPHKRALTELGKHTHVPHKRAPTSTPHTKGKMILPMGACPHRYYRTFPLCVVWMLAVFCVARVCTWIICLCIAHIYTHYIWFLYGQLWLKNMISDSILAEKYELWVQFWLKNIIVNLILAKKSFFTKVRFRPWDPSKKLRHVIRSSLLQFPASEH